MGKPSAPAPPDYAAAAQAQGTANVNSAVATNFLNQADQTGPNGSLKYSYDYNNGYTDPQTGQVIPHTTATTTLSPDQQKLYDQNTYLAQSLNDIAGKGLNYVGQVSNTPIDTSGLPSRGQAPNLDNFNSTRDAVTNAMLARLEPQINRDRDALTSKLANQGIGIGSKAYETANTLQGQNENDLRTQALLAGTSQANTMFNQGLASAQYSDQARNQALQEQDYLRNAPLNMLNALRTGNQVQMPSFGNVSGGSNIQAAPIYQATQDQYQSALDQYKTKMSGFGSLLGGLGALGGAAIGKWG